MRPIRPALAVVAATGCLVLATLASARTPMPSEVARTGSAPDSFVAEFRTTKGTFQMKARRAWAPLGVDRLWQLVNGRYFDGLVIYRVGTTKSVKDGRVVQFGASGDTAAAHAWERETFADEPVTVGHVRGAVSFARGGPATRSVEVAISVTPCAPLDTVQYLGVTGFPVIAIVERGLDVLDRLEGRYGNAPIESDSLSIAGGAWLDRRFPGLDRIERARIVKRW
jgi:peptidyl-prolyl cis-trans isomerase A (cyclophilin A)